MNLKTPEYYNVVEQFRDSVYEPSEDTFLLLDALEMDMENILKVNPTLCLEIGSGSGVVITALARLLKNSTYFLSTDVNSDACLATIKTACYNEACVEAIETDLVNGLMPRLNGLVDVLIFNPPYVVTPSEEVGKKDLSSAWAGGTKGREVIDKVLPIVNELLSLDGCFYLVVIKENNIDEIQHQMKKFNFLGKVIKSRKTGPEHLSVIKFCRC